jgi:serine phosphatase RsbU (regulator of sigma subunit)
MSQEVGGLAFVDEERVPVLVVRWRDGVPGDICRRLLMSADGLKLLSAPASPTAQIICRDGDFFVVVSCAGAATVNGAAVRGEARLRDGDVVRAGASEVRFELQANDGSSSARSDAERVIRVADFIKQSRALHVLSHATASLLAHPPLPQLFERILDLVLETVPADSAAILMLQGDPRSPVQVAGRTRQDGVEGPRVSQSVVRRVLDRGESVLINDLLNDVDLAHQPSIVAHPIGCAVCAPLWMTPNPGDPVKIIGVLYASTRAGGMPLWSSDLEILTVLANTAAVNIETSSLMEARLEQQRLREELRVAGEIQACLLPREPPNVPGYDLSTHTQSSAEVGGDYVDAHFDGHDLRLALGDVAGKGMGAALLMVELRSTVRAHWQKGDLREAAQEINRHFHENVPQDRYATFFLARLRTEDGQLSYVNAGHNPPLLLSADGRCRTLVEGGTVFGAFADAEYSQGAVTMAPGDTLVVYSDGISETWPEVALAERELGAIVRSVGPQGASRVLESIFAAAERREAKTRDDRAVIVLQRH